MSLPRWTAYPALGVLGLFLLTAVPRRTSDEVPAKTKYERVVVLGIDGLDPEILAEVVERFPERMPNFIKLIEEGGIHSLGTSIPPQSPVAWSNFITGRDPGGHGIFDFIHRDPVTRGPIGSTSKTEAGSHLSLWGDWQFPLGGASESNRSGRSFWEVLAENDIPADIWRMPANFPVEPSKGVSFPGMMTPTLESAYGTYIVYTTDPPVETQRSGGRYVSVRNFDGVISTRVEGPANPFKEGNPQDSVPLVIYVDEEAGAAAIQIDGGSPLVADVGEWTDFTSVDFELLPMGSVLPGGQMTGTVRFFVRSLAPEFQMYMSPVNFDPMAPATPMSEPSTASEDLAAAIGFYYTQGMAEEVNALKDGAISEEDFIDQAGLVYDERVRMMDYALDRYLENEEGGLLFFYYSTVDLCCHMLWDHFDERHPFHRAAIARGSTERWTERAGSTWKDVVYDLYMKMDPVLGEVRRRVGDDTTLMVMSDHGFAPWRRKFSLNRWLYDEGYLVLKEGKVPEGDGTGKVIVHHLPGRPEDSAVDWTKTRAYGAGFNGLYLNMKGREGIGPDGELGDPSLAGIVEPGAEADALLRELKEKLEAIVDEENGGARVVYSADITAEVYKNSERLAEAPDMQVGYDAGYGNSDASSTGRIPSYVLADNNGGTFNGNHLMASQVVAGSLLSNRKVLEGDHALEDLTVEILRRYGITPDESMKGSRVLE